MFHSLEAEALGVNVHTWQQKLLKLLSFDMWPNGEGHSSNDAIL